MPINPVFEPKTAPKKHQKRRKTRENRIFFYTKIYLKIDFIPLFEVAEKTLKGLE